MVRELGDLILTWEAYIRVFTVPVSKPAGRAIINPTPKELITIKNFFINKRRKLVSGRTGLLTKWDSKVSSLGQLITRAVNNGTALKSRWQMKAERTRFATGCLPTFSWRGRLLPHHQGGRLLLHVPLRGGRAPQSPAPELRSQASYGRPGCLLLRLFIPGCP